MRVSIIRGLTLLWQKEPGTLAKSGKIINQILSQNIDIKIKRKLVTLFDILLDSFGQKIKKQKRDDDVLNPFSPKDTLGQLMASIKILLDQFTKIILSSKRALIDKKVNSTKDSGNQANATISNSSDYSIRCIVSRIIEKMWKLGIVAASDILIPTFVMMVDFGLDCQQGNSRQVADRGSRLIYKMCQQSTAQRCLIRLCQAIQESYYFQFNQFDGNQNFINVFTKRELSNKSLSGSNLISTNYKDFAFSILIDCTKGAGKQIILKMIKGIMQMMQIEPQRGGSYIHPVYFRYLAEFLEQMVRKSHQKKFAMQMLIEISCKVKLDTDQNILKFVKGQNDIDNDDDDQETKNWKKNKRIYTKFDQDYDQRKIGNTKSKSLKVAPILNSELKPISDKLYLQMIRLYFMNYLMYKMRRQGQEFPHSSIVNEEEYFTSSCVSKISNEACKGINAINAKQLYALANFLYLNQLNLRERQDNLQKLKNTAKRKQKGRKQEGNQKAIGNRKKKGGSGEAKRGQVNLKKKRIMNRAKSNESPNPRDKKNNRQLLAKKQYLDDFESDSDSDEDEQLAKTSKETQLKLKQKLKEEKKKELQQFKSLKNKAKLRRKEKVKRQQTQNSRYNFSDTCNDSDDDDDQVDG